MTTTTTDSRINIIRKLLTQAACPGATAAESEAFMAKAQVLIAKYNISEKMLEEAQEEEAKKSAPYTPDVKSRRVYSRGKGKMPTWILTLAGGVAEANGCKHWYSSSMEHGSISALGTDGGLEAFELVMPFLIAEVDRLYAEEKPYGMDRGEGKRWATSFRNGCSARIAARLRETQRKAAEEMRREAMTREDRYLLAMKEGDTATILEMDANPEVGQPKYALAKVETALARIEQDKEAVQAEYEKMKFRRGPRRYTSNVGAYRSGHAAGGRANISGPKGRIRG